MPVQLIRKVRTSQPTSHVGIDWSNKITAKLLFATSGANPDSISAKVPVISGAFRRSNGQRGDCCKAPSSQTTGGVDWPVNINIEAGQDYSWLVFAKPSTDTGSISTHALTSSQLNNLSVSQSVFYATIDNNTYSKACNGTIPGIFVGLRRGSTAYAYIQDGTYSSGVTGTRAQVITNVGVGRGAGLNNIVATETYMMAIWGRALSDRELKSLSDNPWQIFEPETIPLFFSTVTAQYARPTSDVSTGTWTASSGSDLFAMLDETTASDADYIITTGASTCEVALGTLSDPASSSGHVVRYRISADSGGITVRLRQGTTTIATWTHASAPTSLTTYAQTLTSGEADSITDYAALKLQFEATA